MKKWSTGIKAITAVWLIAIAALAIQIAKAEEKVITYDRATEWTDGTELYENQIQKTEIWCDGVKVGTEDGADGQITIILNQTSTCQGRHLANNLWSELSNEIEIIIAAPPNPPVLTGTQ